MSGGPDPGGRRVAFVSGASRGIGRATCLALAERGFDLAIAARSRAEGEVRDYSTTAKRRLERALPGSLESTAREVRARGREALALPMDLLDAEQVERAAEQALAHFGAVDVLVNNAIYQGPGVMDRVLDLTPEHLERLLRANVGAQLRLVQRLLPGMLARGRGCVIDLISAAGHGDPPAPGDAGGWGFGYGASKAAFERLAGALAVEHAGSGVRFWNLDPGLVATESMKAQGLTDELLRRFQAAPPEVPAAVIAWLASGEAPEDLDRTVHAQPLCRARRLLPGWPADAG